ncbi:hypothetical protein [Paenarthrobacter sp. NEAU-H11]|uniref:hypothetical protein n=1 Tax=Paenarthrobacter sp. NEAU-H11 TaxID=3423924 RepID=UPI003D34CFF9
MTLSDSCAYGRCSFLRCRVAVASLPKEINLPGTIAYVRDHPAVIKTVQEG